MTYPQNFCSPNACKRPSHAREQMPRAQNVASLPLYSLKYWESRAGASRFALRVLTAWTAWTCAAATPSVGSKQRKRKTEQSRFEVTATDSCQRTPSARDHPLIRCEAGELFLAVRKTRQLCPGLPPNFRDLAPAGSCAASCAARVSQTFFCAGSVGRVSFTRRLLTLGGRCEQVSSAESSRAPPPGGREELQA